MEQGHRLQRAVEVSSDDGYGTYLQDFANLSLSHFELVAPRQHPSPQKT